jgi:PAS domain S-box-containing protein
MQPQAVAIGSLLGNNPFICLDTAAGGKEILSQQLQLSVPRDLGNTFAAAMRETRVPVVVIDPRRSTTPFVYANSAFCGLTGYSSDEILRHDWSLLQGPETDPAAFAQITAAIQAEEPIAIEIRNYRKDRSSFWNRLLMEPVRDATGAVTYFIVNNTDITTERERIAERRDDEDKATSLLAARTGDLVEANRKLQVEVDERERGEAALTQMHKMEAIGQLTGGIAHDFNNLLGGIIGSLELLQNAIAAGRPDELERYASTAIASARRAAALTQRLLAFARRRPLKAESTDANRSIAGMEDLLRRVLGPSITIEMKLANDLRPSLCDPNLLENAILNLAINARDAMPDGGRLTIATANANADDACCHLAGNDPAPRRYVMISVTDTGVGMTAAVAARALEPFFTTKVAGVGTGIGLSMVHGFVKQSNGHIRVQSKPGVGSTFKLYLPWCDGGVTGVPVEAPLETAPTARTTASESVLIVDDEDTFRMVVNETLRELGYRTQEAADAPSALRILRSDQRIDLLVTDIGLPGMDGCQLAEAARGIRPALPVLFTTGYAHEDASGNGITLDPGTELLSKPFTLRALGRTVQIMLAARTARAET